MSSGSGTPLPSGQPSPATTTAAAGPGASPRGGGVPRQSPHIPLILPHERVFPIQIGSELFKLSGASLSSDAPSYFSQCFQCQMKAAEAAGEDPAAAVRTLYIDRDPVTFRDISLHLQGYHVAPRDGTHFVRLFADAQFYSLPRLISQLYEESIFISIGHREFQIPRDLFQDPGNAPNFFTLGFAIFFSSPHDLFPGLDRRGLIRPPSILPPAVPNRSADTFAELLRLLRGYPVEIRSEEHRSALLRDCRYFNFKGLEQRLIAHARTYNQARQRLEIVLRLHDILKSGISVVADPPFASTPMSTTVSPPAAAAITTPAWVCYARPFVDDGPAELVLEIGAEDTKLHFLPAGLRAELFRDARTRIARLLEVVATKLSLPPTTQPLGLLMARGGAAGQPPSPGNTPLSDDLVRVVLEPDTAISLDGQPFVLPEHVAVADQTDQTGQTDSHDRSAKRRRVDYAALAVSPATATTAWIVRTGQWRLRIQPASHGKSAVECVLVGVRLDAIRSELARNRQRGFLGGDS
ncbi:btb/poz-like protein [Grosmannia clavigera kw1407]|uniref:Btb/poz-like protein n=1 Tax=Grosmannia clavigera (strain kw1407 / UAMH 11150) TaxID=655863 RepID=F0X6X5_GROCL|nr:btb/poz-like protein [Grosmannia clavigera kw1407]EFX06241.1 btb/poz-like protein [Grosmannia clavigera kw1407]